MKLKLILMIYVTVLSFSTQGQVMPKLGTIWNKGGHTETKLYVPKYGLINSVEIEVDDVKFSLGLDNNNTIVFISTADKSFKIGNAKFVGKKIKSFSKEINLINGWANYISLDAGWFAASDFKVLNDQSKITFLFQYLDKSVEKN